MHPGPDIFLSKRRAPAAALALDGEDTEAVNAGPVEAGHRGRLSRVGRGGKPLSIEARQHAPGTRHTSLDRKQNLSAVVAAGSNLIRYQQDRYGG